MKLTAFQLNVLQQLNWSHTPLGNRFNDAWNDVDCFNPVIAYESVMDIQSPLIDEVRVHLIAQTLLGAVK